MLDQKKSEKKEGEEREREEENGAKKGTNIFLYKKGTKQKKKGTTLQCQPFDVSTMDVGGEVEKTRGAQSQSLLQGKKERKENRRVFAHFFFFLASSNHVSISLLPSLRKAQVRGQSCDRRACKHPNG